MHVLLIACVAKPSCLSCVCDDGPWLLDRPSRDAAVSNLGDTSRARILLQRLRRGEDVTVASIGGSITHGHGSRGGVEWSRAVFDWLSARWPAAHGEHRYVNAAVAAVPPGYHVMCMQDRMPARVDLLLLELAANSDVSQTSSAGAMELLIRRALRWPGAPVVLLVDWLSIRPWGRSAAMPPPPPPLASRAAAQARSVRRDEWEYYAQSARTVLRQMAAYYRLAHLSSAAALIHLDR